MSFRKCVMIAGISGVVLTVGGEAWSGQELRIGAGNNANIQILEKRRGSNTFIRNGDALIKTGPRGGAEIQTNDTLIKNGVRGSRIETGDVLIKTSKRGSRIEAGDTTVDSNGSINAGGVRISPNGGISFD